VNPYFKKLNIKFDIENLSITTEDKKIVDQYVTWQKYGVSLAKKQKFIPTHATGLYADDEAKIKILKQLPKAVLDLEVPVIGILELSPRESDQEGTSIMFPPHIDIGRVTSINIYENINGEETSFYEYEKGGKINKVASFTAQNGDVYLLNVSKPHSVQMIPNKKRKFFSVYFKETSFEQLVSII
jgi:hypothetical protein